MKIKITANQYERIAHILDHDVPTVLYKGDICHREPITKGMYLIQNTLSNHFYYGGKRGATIDGDSMIQIDNHTVLRPLIMVLHQPLARHQPSRLIQPNMVALVIDAGEACYLSHYAKVGIPEVWHIYEKDQTICQYTNPKEGRDGSYYGLSAMNPSTITPLFFQANEGGIDVAAIFNTDAKDVSL